MKELTQLQKKKLKSMAHHLKPLVQIGHKGMTDNVIEAINHALDDHELIKIKFLDFKDEKHELAEKVSRDTDSVLISIVGNIAVLYRWNSNDEKRKITI